MLLYDVFIFIFENCLVIIYKVVEYMLKCLFKILVEFFIYDSVNKRVNVIVDKFKEMGIQYGEDKIRFLEKVFWLKDRNYIDNV